MKKLKAFIYQTGFTLVETLLAIAISTGTALIIYKVIGESQKGQMLVENKDDLNQIHREIVGKFTDRFTCTNTLLKGMGQNGESFSIPEVLNDQNMSVLKIPFQVGKIKLNELSVTKIDKRKNIAEVQASYSHSIGGKEIKALKSFRLELSFKNNQFEGCISRGTLGLDPKEACDLVVGYSEGKDSYFFNGKCNFAQAACEQSGRSWDIENQKCNFSTEDLEALRREICNTLGFGYLPEYQKCAPSDEMIEAAKKYMQQQK